MGVGIACGAFGNQMLVNQRGGERYMFCNRCKWDASNGGTQEDRQAHCPNCKWEEPPSSGDYSLEAVAWGEDYATLHAKDVESTDIVSELGLADNQLKLILEFVAKVCELEVLDRLIIFAMIDGGGDNNRLVESTGLSRQTIINHRRKLEADEYWRGFLKLAHIEARHTRPNRKKATFPNGLRLEQMERLGGKRLDCTARRKEASKAKKREAKRAELSEIHELAQASRRA